MYWIISITFLAPFIILEAASNSMQRNIIRFFAFSIFTLMITGSYYNGIDWINYINHYHFLMQHGVNNEFSFIYEPGYIYFNWFFSNLLEIKNYFIIPFFCNLLFSISLFYTLNRITIKINTSLYLLLTLLFITPLFNDGYRQLLALTVLLPFIFKLDSISFKKWLIGCIIASSFHFSSLLLIPFWFIFRIKFTQKKIYLAISFVIIFTFTLSNLTILIELFNSLLPPIIYNKLIYYISTLDNNFRFGFFVIFDIIGIILAILNRKREHNHFLWNVVFVYFLLHFSFYFAPFFQRVLFYFYPLMILYLFTIRRDIMISVLILLIGFLSFFRYITNPYYSSDFWEPKFYYFNILNLESTDLGELKNNKCSTISKFDDNFCR